MEPQSESPRATSSWQRAERAILTVLQQSRLNEVLPVGMTNPRVAVLGAGAVVESKPLTEFFEQHQFGKPTIVAFDIDPSQVGKLLTEGNIDPAQVSLDYRRGDVSNLNTFGDEKYDMVVIRRPASHDKATNWGTVFTNGFTILNPQGVMLVTTYEDSDLPFVRKQVSQGGKEIVEQRILEDKSNPFFSEEILMLARKK